MRDHSFHDFVVHELLADFPEISSRAMFGGWGVYSSGKMFGIISDDALYVKVDDTSRCRFEDVDSGPFTFKKRNGTDVSLSYYLVPEEVFDNRELFDELIESSLSVG